MCQAGAILDQSTSAAGFINDAIDNLTDGGQIFIRAGTYVISSTVTINGLSGGPRNITLTGEGNSTVLMQAAGANIAVIYISYGWGDTVEGFTVDGNRANQGTSGNGPLGNGQSTWLILSKYSNQTVVRNMVLDNGYSYGIFAYRDTDDILQNNIVTNVEEDSIHCDSSTGCLIQGNVVDGGSDIGITALSSSLTQVGEDNIIIGNIVRNISYNLDPFGANSHTCISLQPMGQNMTDNVISNNVLQSCKGYGIDNVVSHYAVRTVISGNSFTNDGCGIWGKGFDYLTITANTFYDTAASGGCSGKAIVFYQSSPASISRHVTITGNTFSNIVADGLDVQGGDFLIQNNIFSHIYGYTIDVSYSSASNIAILGNYFEYTDNHAIVLSSRGVGNGIQIMNNVISGNASYYGIDIGAGSQVLVEGNSVSNSSRCVYIGSGASYVSVIANSLWTCATPISDNLYAYVVLKDNVNYNPKGHISSPWNTSPGNDLLDVNTGSGASTPTSTIVYTVWESPKMISVSGGTVTQIQIDGTTLGLTSGSWTLQPGETFEITYSGSPTFVVSGQ